MKKKKKKIKISKRKFVLRVKKIVLFDDTELFEEKDYSDIPDLTEEEIDKMIEELKNS